MNTPLVSCAALRAAGAPLRPACMGTTGGSAWAQRDEVRASGFQNLKTVHGHNGRLGMEGSVGCVVPPKKQPPPKKCFIKGLGLRLGWGMDVSASES
jgi:hypothetical protein